MNLTIAIFSISLVINVLTLIWAILPSHNENNYIKLPSNI